MRVKYIRWSTLGQSAARQLLDNNKYDLILQEQISGSIAFAKRPKGAELLKLIDAGKVSDIYVEEFSRLGRNAFDTLSTLNICEQHEVVVHIQNMNLVSRIDGKPNPIFKMFSYIVSVIAEQEKELIKERTEMGKIAARQKGVVFGRKTGSNERKADFLNKENNKLILKYLVDGHTTVREIAKLTDSSTATVMKVKRVGIETKQIKTAI
jgi:DNA invertase Pin-like site-specific DNA recombinase